MESTRLYSLLAITGTLPFVACAVLPLTGVDAIPPFGDLHQLASSYALAIVTFLAGAHWGTYLSTAETPTLNLFVSSNVVFLVAWFAFVATSIGWAIVTQIVALVFLLLVDYRLMQSGLISGHYFRIRSTATAIAIISLSIILLT